MSEDLPVVRDHRRQWRKCRYVYPVISRRSKGLSVGVNLNPEKRCNFRCVYCQIDRSTRRHFRSVLLPVLEEELRLALEEAVSGRLWREERLAATPPELRRLNDIAFSGDGEPTVVPEFDRTVAVAAGVKEAMGLAEVKIVVITNASRLEAPQFRRALPILDAHNGEVWAKLDAGTEEYFRRVNRPLPSIRLEHILDNILSVAVARPIVIQTLLLNVDGRPPPEQEVRAYVDRLRWLIGSGGRVKLVQLYTVARPPMAPSASAISKEQLEAIAEAVRTDLPGLAVETYAGAQASPEASG